MNISKFFLLTWKKVWVIIVGGFISILLHNLISGLLGVEEAFFFFLVVFVIPAYLIISIPFTIINSMKKKKMVRST